MEDGQARYQIAAPFKWNDTMKTKALFLSCLVVFSSCFQTDYRKHLVSDLYLAKSGAFNHIIVKGTGSILVERDITKV